MRSAIGLAAGLGLVGCSFSGGSLPPSSSEITGTLVNRTASNNADLVPEVMDVPAAGATLRFRFDDGSESEVTVDLDGNFSVARATSGYVVELAAGATVVELREEASELVLGGVFAGRQAEPVTELTPIRLPLFPDPSNAIVLASVGQWTSTATTMQEFDWRAATPTGGLDVGLLDSETDRLFALQYAEGVFAPGQVAIARFATAAVDMKDGAPVDLSDEAPLPQVPNTCVGLDASNESTVSRFADELGEGYGPLQRQWSIAAVPSLETQVVGAATLTAASATTFDFSVEAPFADPFPNHALLVNASATALRIVTLPDTTATSNVIDAVVQTYPANRADKCDSNVVSLVDDGIAFVTSIELDGIALVSDHQLVSVQRPDDVEVAWMPSGAADYYDVQLVEVVEESGKLGFEVRRGFRTRSQEISIAESLLVRGSSYVIRVFAITGHAAAAEGNYLDVTYPASSSVHTSRVFRVE